MLPADMKKCREAASEKALQTTITSHFKPVNATRCIPYSDKIFLATAIEWLVHADLVSPFSPHSHICANLLMPF